MERLSARATCAIPLDAWQWTGGLLHHTLLLLACPQRVAVAGLTCDARRLPACLYLPRLQSAPIAPICFTKLVEELEENDQAMETFFETILHVS